MLKYLLFLGGATFLSVLVTPAVRLLALKLRILDYPSERKIHEKPIPLLGGVPIFIAFNLTIAASFLLKHHYIKNVGARKWLGIAIGQMIILGLGIFDDVKRARPFIKFIFQLTAGFIMIIAGFSIGIVNNPFTGHPINLGFWSIPITLIWMIGITNALNLVDGLDGLAAGVSFFACMTIFGIAYIYQNIDIALVSVILGGSILGFLRYNFFPAKIFLGDSGSLYLGFLLSVFSLEGTHKGAVLVAVMAPILALGLPIMDTILSVARRLLKPIGRIEKSEERGIPRASLFRGISIFKADKDHIHHRLLKLGLGHKRAVFLLYGISVALCILALVTVASHNLNIAVFVMAIIIVSIIGIRSLNYQEFNVLKSGAALFVFNIPIIGKRFFQAFIDLFFISLSYYLTFLLVLGSFQSPAVKALFLETFPAVILVKVLIFYLFGLYKSSWKYSTIGDFVKILQAVVLSTLFMVSALAVMGKFRSFSVSNIIFYVLDFYFLLSLVAGSRISFRIFEYIYHNRRSRGGKSVLIYGAGRRGSLLMNELRHKEFPAPHILGFIDDDERKRGKQLHNIPILGNLLKLEEFICNNDIKEIICSTDKISPENIERLRTICERKGVVVKYFTYTIAPTYKTDI